MLLKILPVSTLVHKAMLHILGVCYSSTRGSCICQDSSREAEPIERYIRIYIKGFVAGLPQLELVKQFYEATVSSSDAGD